MIDPRRIEAGQTITQHVALRDGDCLYDIRATLANQAAQAWYRQADLCRFATLVFAADPNGGIILRTR